MLIELGAIRHLSNALKLDPDNSTFRKDYKVSIQSPFKIPIQNPI